MNPDTIFFPPETSRFSTLRLAQTNGPFALEAAFRADTDLRKVNLIIGAYRDDEEKPWHLPSVTEAKRRLELGHSHHEYLPLQGSPKFVEVSKQVLFGPKIVQQQQPFLASIQTVSGTGANSLVAMFLEQKHLRPTNIWLLNLTWINHGDIWKVNAPNVSVQWYPYYNDAKRALDFDAMMETLQRNCLEHDTILFHACAHNPTGRDPSQQQWRELAHLCLKKRLFVIFDSAYQGCASGDLDRDAWAIRHFVSHPSIELAVCQSFSKNLGLYGERVGALHLMVHRSNPNGPNLAKAVQNNLIDLQRACVSMAPLFGSRVASEVLGNEDLQQMWKSDLSTMSGRIRAMRSALRDELLKLQTPGSWDHITEQTGMFSCTGLSKEQVEDLQLKHHIYLLPTGRASMCGVTSTNVSYIARAIHEVVSGQPADMLPK
ncbi:unnamed protein product [Clonostachys byssicola]|uniref:Aspartate aminotransferase n=1 Tax=Clonostachys byssicola TaxID=160290 RepID=A0A9N9UX14_9HYPO|nr:unnamed protein product [Clonostachys byssicola]